MKNFKHEKQYAELIQSRKICIFTFGIIFTKLRKKLRNNGRIFRKFRNKTSINLNLIGK